MTHPNCPFCGKGSQGVIVTFPNPDIQSQIQAALAVDFRRLWRPVTETSTWFDYKFIYDCLAYWQEFYDVSRWQANWGHLHVDGEVHFGDVVPWTKLIDLKPTLFVDDVIQSNSIRMMMQPIVDVKQGVTIGYEMLARGVNADGTVISPSDLYAAAREQNQLFRLDKVCRMAAIEASQVLPQEMLVFINFVPTSIYVPQHCLTTTLATVEELGIHHKRIVFEVVETDRVRDLNHLRNILDFYREKGFNCALDDFGEGFSDAKTMAALKPDIVKLDRKYVTDIHLDETKQRLAAQVHRQGTAIGAQMLAEGIECVEEATVLAQLGYHLQQGYWYGRPDWNPPKVDTEKLGMICNNL